MTIAEATEEQEMVRTAARRALADAVDKRDLRSGKAEDPAFVARIWALAGTMGWTGLLVPATAGGLGLGLADAALLGEELGRALFPAPFVATAIATVTLACALNGPGWRADILPAIAAGRMRLAIAGLDALIADAVPAALRAGSWLGQYDLVEYADSATHFLVIAPSEGARLTAFIVPADAAGIAIAMRQPFDITCSIGSIDLSAVPIAGLLCGDVSADTAQAALASIRIMLSAELVGIAGAALDMTLTYARERRQFGVPIGSFQAIKHRLADGFVLLESARLATHHAAASHDAATSDRDVMVDAARRCAIEAALRVTADCVQVHGALGFSWDHDAHLFLKRAHRLVATLRGTQAARDPIADLLAEIAQGRKTELFSPIGLTSPALATD